MSNENRIIARKLIKKIPSTKIVTILNTVKDHVVLKKRDSYALKLLFNYIDSYDEENITNEEINKIKELLCLRRPKKDNIDILHLIMKYQCRILLILNTYFIITNSEYRLESKLNEKVSMSYDNIHINAKNIFEKIDKNNEILGKSPITRKRMNLLLKRIYFNNELFKEKIDNMIILRNDLIYIIQTIEEKSKTNIKTRSSVLSNNSISYVTHDYIILFNMLMKVGIDTLKNSKPICSKEIRPTEKK